MLTKISILMLKNSVRSIYLLGDNFGAHKKKNRVVKLPCVLKSVVLPSQRNSHTTIILYQGNLFLFLNEATTQKGDQEQPNTIGSW